MTDDLSELKRLAGEKLTVRIPAPKLLLLIARVEKAEARVKELEDELRGWRHD